MPHLVITCGPAGSEKGFVKPKYIAMLQKKYPNMAPITPENTFIAEIENYVESDADYKKAVFHALCEFFDKCGAKDMSSKSELRVQLQKMFDGSTSEECSASNLSQKLFQIYNTTRQKYSRVFDEGIANAVRQGQNVIFETTGQHKDPLCWLWHCPSSAQDWAGPFCSPGQSYVKTVVYPYVDPKEIITLARERFVICLMSWFECLQNCRLYLKAKSFANFSICLDRKMSDETPRLPNLEELQLLISKSQKNIIPYIDNNRVDNIIVFDNDKFKKDPVCFNLKNFNEDDKAKSRCILLKFNQRMAPELLQKLVKVFATS